MVAKTQMMYEGKLYYSMPAAAKLLGTTTTKLKQLIEPEGIEYCNFRVNGPLWVSASDLASYLRRREQGFGGAPSWEPPGYRTSGMASWLASRQDAALITGAAMFTPITHRQQACLDLCGEDELLFLNGHDDAIIGVAERDGVIVVVYDQKLILCKLCQRDGMDAEGAEEFFEFNIAGAFMGEQTPIFLKRLQC